MVSILQMTIVWKLQLLFLIVVLARVFSQKLIIFLKTFVLFKINCSVCTFYLSLEYEIGTVHFFILSRLSHMGNFGEGSII